MPIIAIAPMLDWTTSHYRFFMRHITKHTLLYTEMLVADAILHGDSHRLLQVDPQEHPIVVQLGGSDPYKLGKAALVCQKYGYSAINLNLGCPSNKVQSGGFGASLMQDVSLVSSCIKAMQDAVSIPITVKMRTGLNYNYNYNYFYDFISELALAGCKHFVVHARNAILSGLSPKQNRDIPPLRYDYVYSLKQQMPQLEIIINGGIKTIEQIQQHLNHVDGVMIGREAYHNPYLLSNFDWLIFNKMGPKLSRQQIALDMMSYLSSCLKQGVPIHNITRHMLGLYHGCSNAKLWRQQLSIVGRTNDLKHYLNLVQQMPD